MSNQCIEATKNQSCARCGRIFNVNELILIDMDADAICFGPCWRTLPAKAMPKRNSVQNPPRTRRQPVLTKPEPAPVKPKFRPLSDIIREGIIDAVKELRKE